ncbi:unnamed protein product, partial [marine sediment metagenome]
WLKITIYCLLGGILLVLLTVVLEQKKGKAEEEELPTGEMQTRILLQNSAEVPSSEITKVLGLVKGHTIYAIWIGKDLSAIVRLVLGGELIEYTDMMGKEERRSRKERRAGEDRRKFNDPNYKGPERRNGQDRRTDEDRRKSA